MNTHPQDHSTRPKRAARPAPWLVLVSAGLSLLGLAVAIYLTIAHYAGAQVLACADSGVVNCAKVTTSAQSMFLGVPVAVLGLASFVVLVALFSPWAWHTTNRWVHETRRLAIYGAMAFVLWLVYAELVLIGSICLWCTVVHLVVLSLFVLTTYAPPTSRR